MKHIVIIAAIHKTLVDIIGAEQLHTAIGQTELETYLTHAKRKEQTV